MKAHLFALCLGLLLPAASAGAADLYTPQPAQPYEPAQTVSQSSGWYLRGDLGYSFNDMKDSYYYNAGNKTFFSSTDYKDSFTIGAGAGYRLTKHFRVDFTGDYSFRSKYGATTILAACGGGGSCPETDRSHVSMLTLLANAYVDLGTWHGVTPYVGAGIGGSHVHWADFSPSTNCALAAACSGPYGGHSDWRFTYALMAGASVDLTCNLKLDAGYRFRHIFSGQTSANLSGTNSPVFDDGINVHDVRAGLRYTFGGCDQPQYASYEPTPAPVYK